MKNKDQEPKDIYILNPGYAIRQDKKRAIIYRRSIDPVQDKEVTDILALIHPVYAIMLAFFDGKSRLKKVIENLADFLKLDEKIIYKLVYPLLENENELNFQYDSHNFHLPKKILIKKIDDKPVEQIDIKQFFIPRNELDFKSWRLYYPLDILFMINTVCVTDCIYCYADRRRIMNCLIPFERLKDLIQEAKKIGIRSFDLTGGEIFLYPYWERLLEELVSTGFTPYISTKVPIGPDIIEKLKEIGIKNIQISIDSIVKDELTRILRVKDDYYEKILKTLENLSMSGITIYTNTQVTNINEGHIESLIKYLGKLKTIKRINVGMAGFSMYSDIRYINVKSNLKSKNRIENFINSLKNKSEVPIDYNFPGYLSPEKYYGEETYKQKNFNKRARCSGNFYALIILPNGQVTICEELYFTSPFIIGDINNQSIEEVWNSSKAINLYKLSKDSINPESACLNCDQFDECHQFRGVCWKEILYAYGEENWDFPDPRCPKAPSPKRVFYLEQK